MIKIYEYSIVKSIFIIHINFFALFIIIYILHFVIKLFIKFI